MRPAGVVVRPFDPSRRGDFDLLHSDANGAGWCRCVAWWVPTWKRWASRSAEENRRLRESLLERGEYDGFLLYEDGVPAGWCQVGPRDRLEKLARQFHLPPDPAAWAITCFLVPPARRRRGLATRLLEGVLRALEERGVKRVEAFPRRGPIRGEDDLWTGPEAMFRAAGFHVALDDPERPVLAKDLHGAR